MRAASHPSHSPKVSEVKGQSLQRQQTPKSECLPCNWRLSYIMENKQTLQNPLVIQSSPHVLWSKSREKETKNRKGLWSLRCNDLSSRATVCPPIHFCRNLHRLPFPAPHIPRISLPGSSVAIAPSWLATNARWQEPRLRRASTNTAKGWQNHPIERNISIDQPGRVGGGRRQLRP